LGMKYNPEIHHRKSIRLKGYDYSSEGAYFITICINNREHFLGNINNFNIELSEAGKMVNSWWLKITDKFPEIFLDSFVIMPDHIHGIIFINHNNVVGADPCVSPNVGKIVQWFKTMTTNVYIRNVKQNGWQPFNKKLWQRNYYEHIIRSEKSLDAIREYIINNPKKSESEIIGNIQYE
jgi:putative transposase